MPRDIYARFVGDLSDLARSSSENLGLDLFLDVFYVIPKIGPNAPRYGRLPASVYNSSNQLRQ